MSKHSGVKRNRFQFDAVMLSDKGLFRMSGMFILHSPLLKVNGGKDGTLSG